MKDIMYLALHTIGNAKKTLQVVKEFLETKTQIIKTIENIKRTTE